MTDALITVGVAAAAFIVTVVAGGRYGSRHTRALAYADRHYSRPLSRRRQRALGRAIRAAEARRTGVIR